MLYLELGVIYSDRASLKSFECVVVQFKFKIPQCQYQMSFMKP